MIETLDLARFLPEYAHYVTTVLEPTERELKDIFRAWRASDYWAKFPSVSTSATPSPFQRSRTRIKRPESVVDKILRKPEKYSQGLTLDSVKTMTDAVAGRVIVYFLSHLELIDRELHSNELLEISKTDAPVAYLGEDLFKRCRLTHLTREDKDSGYASVHYIARLRQSSVPEADRPWFEIQVRTLAEDVWGEIEHLLGYKPDKKTSMRVRRQFRILSTVLTAVDEHFNLLYDELAKYQGEVRFDDDDYLNAENLPAVLEKHGLRCAQKEIDGLLKLLASRGILKVEDFQTIATGRNLDLINRAFHELEQREPNHFEVIATLAAISGLSSAEETVAGIRGHIQYVGAWEVLKRKSRRSRDH